MLRGLSHFVVVWCFSCCLLVVFVLVAHSWLFGICCCLSLGQSSSSVVNVQGCGGVLNQFFMSWLYWYCHFPYYLGFCWAQAIWVAILHFLEFWFFLVNAALGPKKFADPYWPTSAFLSDNKVPGFSLVVRTSASLFWGLWPKIVFALKPLEKVVISTNVSFYILLFWRPPEWMQTWAAFTFKHGPAMLYNTEGPLIPLLGGGGSQTRQVAVTSKDKIDKHRGEMGFGHANCVQVVATKGPLLCPCSTAKLWPIYGAFSILFEYSDIYFKYTYSII